LIFFIFFIFQSLHAKDENPHVDCDVIQMAYCCYTVEQWASNAHNSLFKKVAGLIPESPPSDDTNRERRVLDLDDVFARAGEKTEVELISNLMDSMQESRLKKESLESELRKSCPQLKILGDRMVMQDPSLFMKENMLNNKQITTSKEFNRFYYHNFGT